MNAKLFLFAISLFFLVSCESNDNYSDVFKEVPTTTDGSQKVIQLGKKLNNPYSVDNMKNASSILQNEGMLRSSSFEIKATHLYVRFLPSDSDEFKLLINDSTLSLFSYPLDYELTEGDIFIDSTLRGSEYTWLYTRVPIDFISPIACMEILEELYLPNIEESAQINSKLRSSTISKDDWKLLEERSMEITGNKQYIENSMLRSKWIPKVTVKVYDDTKCRNIPLQGVKVRARKWFNWETQLTDANGVAIMPDDYSGKVNFSIVWESDDWVMLSGASGQAYYNGPSKDSNWDLVIGEGGLSYFYAHIHRACYTYWNEATSKYGIKKPYNDSFWTSRVKIHAYDKPDKSRNNNRNSMNLFSSQQAIVNKSCSHMYQTTLHEFAHISHQELIDNDLDDVDPIVYEAWATGVAYTIAKDCYTLNKLFYGNWQEERFKDIEKNHYNIYTPIVIDLMDDFNQREEHEYNSTDYPIDRVKGYTLKQIEPSLKGVKTLKQWCTKLKEMYDNDTEQYLDELFDQYQF